MSEKTNRTKTMIWEDYPKLVQVPSTTEKPAETSAWCFFEVKGLRNTDGGRKTYDDYTHDQLASTTKNVAELKRFTLRNSG